MLLQSSTKVYLHSFVTPLHPFCAMHYTRQGSAFSNDEDCSHVWEQCSLHHSLSTNATASDLPGAGRSLGLLYGYLGRKFEAHLGRVAEKLGKGPRMTAVRIERRRSEVALHSSTCRKAATRTTKIEKDCWKLIKYIDSDVVSTKRQALDEIIRLATQDRYIQNILLILGASQAIERVKRSFLSQSTPGLFIRSRQALICVRDTEINSVASEAMASLPFCQHETNSASPGDLFLRIRAYLCDLDRAFLVMRYLSRFVVESCYTFKVWESRFVDFGDFFSTDSFQDAIEWDTLDELIEAFVSWNIFHLFPEGFGACCIGRYGLWEHILELVLRYPDRLPKTLNSAFFSWLSAYDCKSDGIDLAYYLASYRLLRGIGMAKGPDIDHDRLVSLDLNTLLCWYPHPIVHPLLRRIACPPEMLLLRILSLEHGFNSLYDTRDACRRLKRMDQPLIHFVCKEFCEYIDSHDDLLHQRALRAVKWLLSCDVYYEKPVLCSLSASRFFRIHGIRTLLEDAEIWRQPVNIQVGRHRDNEGRLLHLSGDNDCEYSEGTSENFEIPDTFSTKDVLEHYVPLDTAFHVEDCCPIPAGINTRGEKTYLARLGYQSGQDKIVAITEGMKPEDLCARNECPGKKGEKSLLYMAVYALRLAPDGAFLNESIEDGPSYDVIDSLFWKPPLC